MEDIKFKAKIIKVSGCDSSTNWAAVLLSDVPKEIKKAGNIPYSKMTVSAAGQISNPIVGSSLIFTGHFEVNPKYGPQFRVKSTEIDYSDFTSIVAFLQSDFVKGCGAITAQKIVDKFKEKTLDVIEHDYKRLTEISGISLKKAKTISESCKTSRKYELIMKLFNGDITANKVSKIVEQYGDKAESVIKKNPYQLIYDIRGFGFLSVDKLAMSAGIGINDPRRVKAGILYSLDKEANDNGHCYIYIDEVASNVRSLIKNITVSDDVIVDQVAELAKEQYIICEKDSASNVRVFLKPLYFAEKLLAGSIKKLLKNSSKSKFDENVVEGVISKIESITGFNFEPAQRDAVVRSLQNHISIITGGPGTGKTTIINAVVASASRMNMPIVLLAPTGRAARRLKDSTKLESFTIAMFNTRSKVFKNDRPAPKVFHNTLFVVDEASMIDVETANELFKHIDASCTVVLVGDIDQLPSIGAGNFFRDLVNHNAVPISKLKFTHRFKGKIAQNARTINNGYANIEIGEDFFYTKEKLPEVRQELIIREYLSALKESGNDYQKVQIIVPMRQKSPTGADTLNQLIRDKINPKKKGDKTYGIRQLRVGDRVMQTQNNYSLGVNNGDCGVIISVDEEAKTMDIKMDIGSIVTYQLSDISDLVLAYAITVHKSQGSEYDILITAYGNNDYVMLQRNLLYTAVTRAKKRCILIADPSAIYRAVNNITPIVRNTSLVEKIFASM